MMPSCSQNCTQGISMVNLSLGDVVLQGAGGCLQLLQIRELQLTLVHALYTYSDSEKLLDCVLINLIFKFTTTHQHYSLIRKHVRDLTGLPASRSSLEGHFTFTKTSSYSAQSTLVAIITTNHFYCHNLIFKSH